MPLVAGLPFFMVIDFGSFISLLVLHLTQYPVVILSISKEVLLAKYCKNYLPKNVEMTGKILG